MVPVRDGSAVLERYWTFLTGSESLRRAAGGASSGGWLPVNSKNIVSGCGLLRPLGVLKRYPQSEQPSVRRPAMGRHPACRIQISNMLEDESLIETTRMD